MIIYYTLPSNQPQRFETSSNTVILGRKAGEGQHIDIDLRSDAYVSHTHACITYEVEEYWIEDLDSENGTWVNGRKILGKTRLVHGAEIRVGKTTIQIEKKCPLPVSREKDSADFDQTGDHGPAEASPSLNIPMDADLAPLPGDRSSEPSASELEANVIKSDRMESEPSEEKERIKESHDFETDGESAREGNITAVKDADTPPFTETGDEEVDEKEKPSWRRLKALNDFIQALGTQTTIEGLGQVLVEQLRQAIPNAQRGALLLPDENGELLLKAHWPEGEHSVSMTWVKRAFSRREAFIWTASPPVASSEDECAPKSAIYYDVQSAIYLPLLTAGDLFGVMYVDNYFIRDAFSPTDFELMRAIANQVAMFLKDNILRKDLQREETLRANLMRQYSPKVADMILDKAHSLQRGGEQVEPVTILVSDVRNFTAISAKMGPDEVVGAINEMFDAFVPIISEFDGIVDKYVGDSVLAVFGSPERDPNQWEKAVQVAIRMQEAMHMLGEGRKIRRLPVFHVGIGIHTGAVIHGFIGSAERIEFTVIGDTVNRAARYCDGAGAGEIIISKEIYERVYHLIDVSPKRIVTKHPDVEPDLEAYVIEGLRKKLHEV